METYPPLVPLSGFQNYKVINLYCVKSPSLWSFAMAAIETNIDFGIWKWGVAVKITNNVKVALELGNRQRFEDFEEHGRIVLISLKRLVVEIWTLMTLLERTQK